MRLGTWSGVGGHARRSTTVHRACTGTLHPERARRARREAARCTRTAPAPEADSDQLGVAGPGGGASDEPGGRDLAARPDDLPLEPGGSPSRICAASGRPAMPARGECSPVDASSAALAASRALNVSMLAFSSPSPTPSACLRSCTALLARREARSCQECRADSRHGRGQEVPGVLPLREADDDRAHYQAGELDSAGRSTR